MPLNRRILRCTASGLFLLGMITTSAAQEGEAASDRIEPASIQALENMGKHLQSLQKFSLNSQTSVDAVLDTDQKLEFGGEVSYEVERPNKLRIDLKTDVVQGEFIYNGTTLTYVSPSNNTYAQAPAPATIKETLEEAAQKYHLTFPLADLFAWGTPDAPIGEIAEGFHVGNAMVNGKPTDHWAYRTGDQDFEVWIASDGPPLPLKVSLVDRDDQTRPRMTAVLNWNETPDIQASAFEFTPPADAQKLRFLEEGNQQ
ncbi:MULTISPECIES: DUF2092 domain-containing protein [Ochrobactrum]|uniref:DUF2092 domain-containing protein n=1 Tax=Ochrobactrum sp. C6C9 TaxID=2736662 RepID=UPI0035301A49